jgi:fatty acid desaturase
MSKKYKLVMDIYWIDYAITTIAFVASFYVVYTEGSIIPYITSCISLYRLGAFTHEIAHQNSNPKIKTFRRVWNLTTGFLVMQPSLRFTRPHLLHHTTGVFGTNKDPQYPLIRSNPKLAAGIFILMPWLLPIYNTLVSLFSPAEGNKLEGILYDPDKLSFSHQDYLEIHIYEYLYIHGLLIAILLIPKVILTLYLVEVGAWFLSTLRIPLEHSLEEYKEVTTYKDQETDSFTHLNPLFAIIQPLGLRYHQLHHMDPKIPYHSLAQAYKEFISITGTNIIS